MNIRFGLLVVMLGLLQTAGALKARTLKITSPMKGADVEMVQVLPNQKDMFGKNIAIPQTKRITGGRMGGYKINTVIADTPFAINLTLQVPNQSYQSFYYEGSATGDVCLEVSNDGVKECEGTSK